MAVTIFMNMSADGYIAKNNDDVPFIADDEWDLYLEEVGKADALIVGRKTYNIMVEAGDFEELGNPQTVVFSNNLNLESDNDAVSFSNETPKEVIKSLTKKNFKNIFVCGGAELNSSFIEERCVDVIKICISPYLLGDGISFLNNKNCETALELTDTKQIANGAILLTYKVKK